MCYKRSSDDSGMESETQYGRTLASATQVEHCAITGCPGVGSGKVACPSQKVSRLESGPRLKVGADRRWCGARGGITSWGLAGARMMWGSRVGFRVSRSLDQGRDCKDMTDSSE